MSTTLSTVVGSTSIDRGAANHRRIRGRPQDCAKIKHSGSLVQARLLGSVWWIYVAQPAG